MRHLIIVKRPHKKHKKHLWFMRQQLGKQSKQVKYTQDSSFF